MQQSELRGDMAMKLLAELNTCKGVGLIGRIKQRQGKPTQMYVSVLLREELSPQRLKKPEPRRTESSRE